MWPESLKTVDLLNEVRQGKPEAVNALLDRHRDALRRMIDMRIDRAVSHRVDASDIVQDVMVEASRRLDDYLADGTMPFHLWLRHMAMDRIIDAHRRHRVARRRSVDREQSLAAAARADRSSIEMFDQLQDQQLTPAAAATQHELVKRFQAAVELLDEPDREVILMRHFEQLSNQEVAQSLGLSGAAASMRYLRAMRRLRDLLAERMPPDEE